MPLTMNKRTLFQKEVCVKTTKTGEGGEDFDIC